MVAVTFEKFFAQEKTRKRTFLSSKAPLELARPRIKQVPHLKNQVRHFI